MTTLPPFVSKRLDCSSISGPICQRSLALAVPISASSSRDVDRLWTIAQSLGLAVEQPTADRSYGLRDFTVRDPDGFGLRFASWLPATAEHPQTGVSVKQTDT
jgi:hypothetical protein